MLDVNTDKVLQTENDRPDLSSERAPHRDKKTTFGQKAISGRESQTVSCNVTSTSEETQFSAEKRDC
jgi:hypothetical protein